MPSVKALRRWLIVVAAFRMLSVYLGYFDHKYFKSHLFNLQPEQVTELYGRTFAVWTLLSCTLCLICARYLTNAPIYGATLFSFVAALLHFLTEAFVYKTLSLKAAATPLLFAGVSTLWMGAGWNYYLYYTKVETPGLSKGVDSSKQE